MCEITIHTGCQDDYNTINIDWFNESGVKLKSVIEVIVQSQDFPRTLEIKIDTITIAEITREKLILLKR